MSRAVKIDFSPDREKFSRLIDLARGNRTLKQYAQDAGVNVAYLSKISNALNECNVTPFFIGKLASAAFNGVTYDQIMTSAGFDPKKHPFVMPSVKKSKKLSSEYEDGVMAGFSYARNAVFDALSKEGTSINDIVYALCVAEPQRAGRDILKDEDIKPGFIVKEAGGNEDYIVASVMGNSCIVIMHDKKLTSILKNKLFYTGHRINETILETLVARLEED